MTYHLQIVELPVTRNVSTTQYTGITYIQGEVTMNSITQIGMDVHTTNYTLCAFTLQTQSPFFELQVRPEFVQIRGILWARRYDQGNTAQVGAADFSGSFAPIVQYEKLEIYPVFPHFPYFRSGQNLSPNLLAPLCGVALGVQKLILNALRNDSFRNDPLWFVIIHKIAAQAS